MMLLCIISENLWSADNQQATRSKLVASLKEKSFTRKEKSMTEKRSKKKKKTERKASVVVIPNKPEAPLSHDRDFMKALHDFQYGEDAETSNSGFERMVEHGLNPKRRA